MPDGPPQLSRRETLPIQGFRRVVFASLVAPLVPVLLYASSNRGIGARFVVVALIAFYLHAAVGIPILTWLRGAGRLGIGRAVLISALVGAIPITVWTLSIGLPEFESVGGIVIVRDGRLTMAGYWEIVRDALEAGGLGTSAGIVWHYLCRHP